MLIRNFAATLIFLPTIAWTQAGLGSIQGTIVDPSDSLVPGAKVRLVQVSTNTERQATSTDAGLFSFPSLVPSNYTLTISAPGFQERKIENITINAFQTLSLGRLQLSVGEASTTVNVEADTLAVAEDPVRMEAVQSKQVTSMPLNGRNWSTLLKIIPGATPRNTNAINGREASYDGYADFRINGKNASQTQVNLDGGSVVDHGNDAKTTVAPSLEAIQEVAVLTNNFRAEYGYRSGAVINVVTKSGGNQFHGTAWDYIRNEALNANSWSNNYFGLPRQRYRYNYFGGNLGGPVRKDKLFFFYNHENLKQDTPTVTRQVRVPTALERNGDFSETINADGTRPRIFLPGTQAGGNPQQLPNNIIPVQLRDELGMNILKLYPEPNLRNETNNNYLLQYARINPRTTNVGKVDWNISDRTRAYMRYNYDYGDLQDIVGWTSAGDVPFAVTKFRRPDHAAAANLTHSFSPTLISETLFGWSYDYPHSGAEDSLFPEKIDRSKVGLDRLPNFFKTQYGNILPQIDPGGTYPGFNFNRFPVFAIAHEYQWSNNWTWTRGAHIIKFGGQFIRNTKDEIDGSVEKGVFAFGVNTASDFDMGYSPANMVTGALNQYRQESTIRFKSSFYNDLHFFLQDTWKASSKLTLDFGLRLVHMPTEANRNPAETLDAVFLPSRWDRNKAPRFYVPNPANPGQVIDPANPNNPVPANVANTLRFSMVPGSGDPLNGVFPLGGDLGRAGLRNPKPILFAPRGGFAWSGISKTVIRGGFGWGYNRVAIGQAVNNFENGLTQLVDIRQTSIRSLISSGTSGLQRLAPRNFGVRDEASQKVPTVYDYSLSVQRELPFDMLLDVAYVGNIQRHQNLAFNINAVIPGAAADARFIDARLAGNNFAGAVSGSNPNPLPGTRAVDSNLMRPYPGLGDLTLTANVANSVYNALQTSLAKRSRYGLSFQIAHTYGYLRTQTEAAGHYSLNWKDYTGFVADNDRRHVVAVNYTYDVPKLAARFKMDNKFGKQVFDGWSVAHLLNFFSGRYITPTFGIQEANTTNGVANINNIFTGSPNFGPRINPLSNPNNGGASQAALFEISAFGIPGIGIGTGARNYLREPSTHSNDINITKTFFVGDKYGLEMRASLFNPFNAIRRTDLNTGASFKANGPRYEDGFRLFNSPDQQVRNLVERRPNATPQEIYNQYRSGFGHVNLTSVQPNRIIEIGLRFRF